VDITDDASIRRLFEEVRELDHLLVTATPPAKDGPFLQQDLKAAQAIMNGKFFGSWACARYAAPRMRGGGSITFLTGGAAIRPRAGIATVSATFAALETLSQALALELGPLRVNTLRPGVIDSDMWRFLDDAAREKLRQKVRETFPARRIGTIEDVGHAALFLMTNPYVTGAVLEISGGETLVTLDL
jgi:NAD(P)-dependent dehydrogenase (short-subunit alcohol dehydrogenase family)